MNNTAKEIAALRAAKQAEVSNAETRLRDLQTEFHQNFRGYNQRQQGIVAEVRDIFRTIQVRPLFGYLESGIAAADRCLREKFDCNKSRTTFYEHEQYEALKPAWKVVADKQGKHSLIPSLKLLQDKGCDSPENVAKVQTCSTRNALSIARKIVNHGRGPIKSSITINGLERDCNKAKRFIRNAVRDFNFDSGAAAIAWVLEAFYDSASVSELRKARQEDRGASLLSAAADKRLS